MNGKITGLRAEEIIKERLGIVIDRHAIIDTAFCGWPYEVKSCVETCITGKSGRFWLYEEQHNELLKHLGYYVFVVLDTDMNAKYSRIVSAERVSAPFSKHKTLTWITLFRRLDNGR